VSGNADGSINIATSNGNISAAAADVVATWTPGDRDPDTVAREADLEGQMRKWSYEAAVGISGKSGNSTKSDFAAALAATLEGPTDRLSLYAGFQYSKAEGTTTADEIIGGMSYTSYFSEHYGWYVREELERDKFENLTFRSTTAVGLNYRPIKTETRSLEFTAGVALRYEGYGFDLDGDGFEDKTGSESLPGLDLGVRHYWKFADWGEMHNSIVYNPAFEDFADDYRLDHISAIDLPLGTADYWKFRVSLQNQYNSSAVDEKLDTTYALSLLLNWK
jgi:putative salt-induced outer membrane protein YdiY|tara:strand:- start:966 stop:1796 length:831 start_codon:yes stop_codon:yes gene_type:complete